MLTATAIVSPVPIGNRSIEGLLLQDGTYAIAVPQICSIFSFAKEHASRDLKAILGKGFSLSKARTTLNSQPVNCVTLKDFEILTFELVLRGNSPAIAFTRDLLGFSLQVLFDDAFDKESTKESRQLWFKNRQSTKDSFWFLAPQIQAWIERNGSSHPQHHYIAAFKAMSVGLFGKTPKEIRFELGTPKGDLIRDHFNDEALIRVDGVQRLATPLIRADMRPETAVKTAIAQFTYEPMRYGHDKA